MSKKDKKDGSGDMELVSFKISKERFAELQKYADTQLDEAGNKLSVGTAARRLVNEGLKRLRK